MCPAWSSNSEVTQRFYGFGGENWKKNSGFCLYIFSGINHSITSVACRCADIASVQTRFVQAGYFPFPSRKITTSLDFAVWSHELRMQLFETARIIRCGKDESWRRHDEHFVRHDRRMQLSTAQFHVSFPFCIFQVKSMLRPTIMRHNFINK
jgi:hypothetical protein